MREPSITARVVIIEEGKLLLTQNRWDRGLAWQLPGGTWEPPETLAETAKREVREECGVEVALGDLLWVQDNFDPELPRQYLVFFFEGQIRAGRPAVQPADPSVIDVRWVPLSEVDQYLWPVYAKALAAYLTGGGRRYYPNRAAGWGV